MDHDQQCKLLLRGCDTAQQAAITSEAAPLLVVAGAGSGKTRVLTRRIGWQIANNRAIPGATLALTFTRKAASELRLRLGELGLPAPVTAGTFHGIALAQLRQRALDRDRPLPVLVESKARILGPILPEWRSRTTSRSPLDRRDLLSGIANEIEWAKARLVSPENYLVEATKAGRTPVVDFEAVAEGYTRYEIERKRRRLFDFDDLLSTLSELIARDMDFAATQRWRFRHFFVDELQDANAAQLRLLEAWLGGRDDLFCVGDARQAIYGWNGADPSAMENFTVRYKGATVMELETNYRSTQQLVRFARAALPTAAGSAPAARAEGSVPTITSYANDTDESIGVAEQIRRIGRSRRRWKDTAVLARTNAQLLVIENALLAGGIPFRQGGGDQFLTRPAVRRALQVLHEGSDRRQNGTQIFRNWLNELELDPNFDDPSAVAFDPTEDVPVVANNETAEDAADLDALTTMARDFADLDPVPTPDGFLSYVRHSLRTDPAPAASDAVELLTFHRAKGLEWPVVFVVGIEDGYIPISRAKTRSSLAEEQRLLYVALSRASDELFCSWARERQFGRRLVSREPSPYLVAIEQAQQELLRESQVNPADAKRAIARGRRLLHPESAPDS